MGAKRRQNRLAELTVIVSILAVAACLRLWRIGSLPESMHYDEVVNGRIASRINAGELLPLVVYPVEHRQNPFHDGREPMFFYLSAISLAALGHTPGALRLTSSLASIGVVIGTILLTRELCGHKVGALAGMICATCVWPLYLGRLAVRPVLLPLLTGFALFAAVRGWRSRRLGWWALSGVLFGGAYYTYPANMFILPALVASATGWALLNKGNFRNHRTGILTLVVATVVVALPIWIVQADSLARADETPSVLSVFYAGQGLRDFLWTVITQSYLILRMFVVKADLNIRHNIPGRPVFDAVMAIPFLVGLVVAWRQRYRWPALLCLGWATMFLLPTFLSKDAPHFLRASGILPVLFVWPALGLAWLYNSIGRQFGKVAATALCAGVLALSAGVTFKQYVLDGFLEQPDVRDAFGADDALLALKVNELLQTGWTGENLRARPVPDRLSYEVWVEEELWGPDIYAQFLVPIAPDEKPFFRLLTKNSGLPEQDAWMLVKPEHVQWLIAAAPESTAVEVVSVNANTMAASSNLDVRFVAVHWSPAQ